MTILNTLNKKTMIAMMIAATGLSTSMAAAQFKVDYTAKPESAPKAEKTEKSIMVFKSHDDEHTYEIKIVNGEVTIASIDGNEVRDDQIKMDGEVIVFISEDGEELHEIKLHGIHNATGNTHNKRVWASSNGKGNNFFNEGEGHFVIDAASASGGEHEKAFFVKGNVAQPKVMLGINLGEPSKILRKHLKLKDGISAILIENVIDGLPAALSGLQDFDVIISIDGSDQADGEILRKILAEKEAGDIMKLVVLRSGDKIKLKVKLAEYNAQALDGTIYYDDMEGYEEIKEKLEATEKNAKNIEFELLTKFENGDFGHIQSDHLAKLKEQLHAHLTKAADQHNITIDLRAKAMDAMKQAERQMVEFQDGKLMIRRANVIRDWTQLDNAFPQALNSHMDGMEARLAALESRIDHQIDEMSEQMDRLMSMFERLMDRLED